MDIVDNDIEKSAVEKNESKKKIRKFLVFIVFFVIVAMGITIYLLVDDNNKYNSYKVTIGDLVDSEKVYVDGLSYYKGVYKYKVGKKEYFYKNPTLYKDKAESIIEIKYNPEDPNVLYDLKLSKLYFIILIVSSCVLILLLVIIVALSPSKVEEIVVAQVVELVNCIGGKRIYLNDINIPKDSKLFYNKKYFVYFSNNNDLFQVGNLIKFNKYKYGEGLLPEKYRNVEAQNIYNFKDSDFTLYKKNM